MNIFILGVFFFFTACQTTPPGNEYVVIAGKGIRDDADWYKVAESLQVKHRAVLLSYKETIDEVIPQLQRIKPRYVAVVEKPENLDKKYVIHLNQFSRQIDNDIYADFLWGIITGYDAKAAMKMVNNSTEPLIVKNAVATIAELQSGKWFDRYAWIDDHNRGMWGEKTHKNDTIKTHLLNGLEKRKIQMPDGNEKETVIGKVKPADEMQAFYNIYEQYAPDLVVTASHASEYNLEMPFSLGNIKSKDGILYMDFPDHQRILPESGKRKIYLPIGNCLLANVNGTKESMAIAWMNSGRAATLVGYVVNTWCGRNGWGGLKYWLTNPGRYTAAEAFYLNQQDMMYQMNNWHPKFATMQYPFGSGNVWITGNRLVMDSTGIDPSMLQIGYLYDRDVLAYYGDPKWDVRLQEIPEENDFTVKMEMKGKKCLVTITTKQNFNLARMKGDDFKKEHVADLPFSYFFPKRLNNPRLTTGQNWKAAIDENFLLLYDVGFEPGKRYIVELDVD